MNLVFKSVLNTLEQTQRFGHGMIVGESEKIVERLPEKDRDIRLRILGKSSRGTYEGFFRLQGSRPGVFGGLIRGCSPREAFHTCRRMA